MRVIDLFEAKRVPTDKGYYTPGYDTDTKNVQGTVKDWLARLGATADDIADAMAQAMKLPSFKAIEMYASTSPGEKKNGTFSFQKPNRDASRDEKYMVYANGQIRSSSTGRWNNDARPTRLKSPKPHLVAGSAVKSLVTIYDGAFKELVKKIDQRVKKASVNESEDDVVKQVFAKLDMTHPTETDRKHMADDIQRKTKKGWTVAEIASHMRNMEEVNPDVDEDTALARMKRISDAVAARLKAAQ